MVRAADDPPPDVPPAPEFGGLGAAPGAPAASVLEEIEVETDGDALTLRHSREEVLLPNIILAISTAVFVLFVIAGLPVLHVTKAGRVLWMLVGFAVLAFIGLAMQVRARVTRIRLDDAGVTINQGTALDREHASIIWSEIAQIELEPVDPADGTKGMRLAITPRAGEPIHTLADVGIGDLTEARQILLSRWKRLRKTAGGVLPRPKVGADAVREPRG